MKNIIFSKYTNFYLRSLLQRAKLSCLMKILITSSREAATNAWRQRRLLHGCFQLCNQQTDNILVIFRLWLLMHSRFICLYTRAYGHTRACHEGGREGFRTTCVGMIRRTATLAANRTAIMRRHGEEKREEAEGDRPNADKARTRE